MDAEDDEEDELACNVTESDDLLAKIFDHSQSAGPVPHDAPMADQAEDDMCCGSTIQGRTAKSQRTTASMDAKLFKSLPEVLQDYILEHVRTPRWTFILNPLMASNAAKTIQHRWQRAVHNHQKRYLAAWKGPQGIGTVWELASYDDLGMPRFALKQATNPPSNAHAFILCSILAYRTMLDKSNLVAGEICANSFSGERKSSDYRDHVYHQLTCMGVSRAVCCKVVQQLWHSSTTRTQALMSRVNLKAVFMAVIMMSATTAAINYHSQGARFHC